jgi:signal peptidase I
MTAVGTKLAHGVISMASNWKLCGLLIAALICGIRIWVMSPIMIEGPSMLPTFRSGQVVMLHKLSYRFGCPQRGDLVCVWTGRELYAKRIIGLPGEQVCLVNGRVMLNGSPLPEPYVQFQGNWNFLSGRLGPRNYLVIGDNRSLSQNDAVLAVVCRDRILGRLAKTLFDN